MKICILTPRFPFPEYGGDVLRINSIARYLKSKGHYLVLVSFVDSTVGLNANAEARTLYDAIYTVKRYKLISVFFSALFFLVRKPIQCGYYYSPFFSLKFRKVIRNENPDIYLSHLLRMVPYIENFNLVNQTIVEMTDALSKTYSLVAKSNGKGVKKLIYKLEKSLIQKYETHVVNKFSKVVLVSQSDIDYLQPNIINKTKSLHLFSNGVDCMDTLPNTYDNKKITFIGNMRTFQNQDAVFYFTKNIFPLILKEIPDAVFYIIGAQPSSKVLSLASSNVKILGFVEDINLAISDSCITVAPVRVAAGIQNKVLVAMGCGVPVVLSSLISKAIPELQNSVNCFVSDADIDFAEKCIKIMKNRDLRENLKKNAFKMVRENYSWERKLDGYINDTENI